MIYSPQTLPAQVLISFWEWKKWQYVWHPVISHSAVLRWTVSIRVIMRTLVSEYCSWTCSVARLNLVVRRSAWRLCVCRCFNQKFKIIWKRRNNTLFIRCYRRPTADFSLPVSLRIFVWHFEWGLSLILFWFSLHLKVTNYQIVLLAFAVVRVADTWPFCQLVPPGSQLLPGLGTPAEIWIELLNILLPADSGRVLLDI